MKIWELKVYLLPYYIFRFPVSQVILIIFPYFNSSKFVPVRIARTCYHLLPITVLFGKKSLTNDGRAEPLRKVHISLRLELWKNENEISLTSEPLANRPKSPPR